MNDERGIAALPQHPALKEYFQSIVEAAPSGMIMIDQSGTILLANREARKQFGYEAGEMIGQLIEMLIPSRFREAHPAWRDAFFDQPAIRAMGQGRELFGIRKDGSEFPVEVGLTPMTAGNKTYVVSSVVDITWRRDAELRLKELNESLEREVEMRTQYVRLLQDIAVVANEAPDVRVAFQRTLNRICTQMDWGFGQALMLKEHDEARVINPGVVYVRTQSQLPAVLNALRTSDSELRQILLKRMLDSKSPEFLLVPENNEKLAGLRRVIESPVRSIFAFPVFVRHQVVAAFEFFLATDQKPDDAFFEVMARVGTQIGRVVERRQLEHALEELTVEEQRRINSDLHDGIGHELSGLTFFANSFLLKLQDEKSPHTGAAEEIVSGIRKSMKELRAVLKGLAVVDIAEDGLPAALSSLAAQVEKRVDLRCELKISDDIDLPSRNTATQLFRIAQEAVNNAIKHARANLVTISLETTEDEIVFTVRDDGVGITQTASAGEGLGLGIMKHRASLIGGTLEITSAADRGTLVCCRIMRTPSAPDMLKSF